MRLVNPPQGNQPLVVKDKVEDLVFELAVMKSMECDAFSFSALTLSDRKGIWHVK